jgi:hypothetical protein
MGSRLAPTRHADSSTSRVCSYPDGTCTKTSDFVQYNAAEANIQRRSRDTSVLLSDQMRFYSCPSSVNGAHVHSPTPVSAWRGRSRKKIVNVICGKLLWSRMVNLSMKRRKTILRLCVSQPSPFIRVVKRRCLYERLVEDTIIEDGEWVFLTVVWLETGQISCVLC